MAAAVPTVEDVITAVHGVVSAIGSIGTVLKAEHHLEDDVELIEVNSYISAGALDLWFIDLEGTARFDGQGRGESYERYSIRIRYWSMRTNDPEWSKKARLKAVSVVDALDKNAAVFAIGGQVQLFTDESVAIVRHEPTQIRDIARAAGQMVWETVLALQVEARRWS